MKTKFKTVLKQAEGMKATGIVIPPEAVAALGSSKKPPVKVTINGYTYRNTVAVMGGVFMVGVSAEHREAAGLKAGDPIEVTLELDSEPRTVELPADLAAALAKKKSARAAFDASSPSARKEFVRQVESAKAQETRDRRIAVIVDKLGKVAGESMPAKKTAAPANDLPANIGAPATRAVASAGIASLKQLAKHSEADILALHGVGAKAVGILRVALHDKGLSFKAKSSIPAGDANRVRDT